ncbi:MAG: hypothetical protein WCS43_12020 [Verrucomicrobiota bacterium]
MKKAAQEKTTRQPHLCDPVIHSRQPLNLLANHGDDRPNDLQVTYVPIPTSLGQN